MQSLSQLASFVSKGVDEASIESCKSKMDSHLSGPHKKLVQLLASGYVFLNPVAYGVFLGLSAIFVTLAIFCPPNVLMAASITALIVLVIYFGSQYPTIESYYDDLLKNIPEHEAAYDHVLHLIAGVCGRAHCCEKKECKFANAPMMICVAAILSVVSYFIPLSAIVVIFLSAINLLPLYAIFQKSGTASSGAPAGAASSFGNSRGEPSLNNE